MKLDDPVLKKCRSVLESLYGPRLRGVILYGSTARGTDTEESDIDLLVLLDGPVDVAEEIFRIWGVLMPVQMELDRLFSVAPADAESYQRGELNFYRNVSEEGIAV
jgi:type I restriction enzyme S subunit